MMTEAEEDMDDKNLLDEVLVSRPTGRALTLLAEDCCCPLLLMITLFNFQQRLLIDVIYKNLLRTT